MEQQEEAAKPNIESSSENTIKEFECNVPFDYSKYPQNTKSTLSIAEGFDKMIAEVKKIEHHLTVMVIMCVFVLKDCQSGSVMFQYFIGDVIETNKSYLFTIDNGEIIKLLSLERPVPANKTDFEKELIDRVNDFKASYEPEDIDKTNVVEIRERYLYDYDTGEL